MKTWNYDPKPDYKLKGPWEDEPDKAHWVDEETGLDCLIVRNHGGALCGYVGVPKAHPCFEKSYNGVLASVHGGLSFADFCADSEDEGRYVCHPKEGAANERVWWLGFDCAHAWDLTPVYGELSFAGKVAVYKDFNYVKSVVTGLALQLKNYN